MSDSGGANGNNWTILTPEESAAEAPRPLTERAEYHEESNTSTTAQTDSRAECQQPREGAVSEAGGFPVQDQQVEAAKSPEPSEETHSGPDHDPAVTPAPVSHVSPLSSLDVPTQSLLDSEPHNQSEGLPEDPAQAGRDPDLFSDSYTHISPSPEEPQPPPLTTETLGGLEFGQEEEGLLQEGGMHPLNGEGLKQEEEESELSQSVTDLGKPADSPVKTDKDEEGEPEVRRRRSLLEAMQRIGVKEEEDEEEGEEEFQLPRREDDSGFSVNKCILGALLLLGLGTLFFSGVFMDLDEESDYSTRELRDEDVSVKQEWLNPEVAPPIDVSNAELRNELARGSRQITELQAQLQAQKDELKVAVGQVAEGARERSRREEVEREHGRLKEEMASLSALQKENERMKRELESVAALHRELDTLRATVTQLKVSAAEEAAPPLVTPTTLPPSGEVGDSKQDPVGTIEAKTPLQGEKVEKKEWKKEKYDTGEKKEWKQKHDVGQKERKEKLKNEWKEERKERKDGGKTEWEEGKEQGKYSPKKGREGKRWQEKELMEGGDGKKKDKAIRGDDGKPWKDRGGQGEWKEKSQRKDWVGEKEGKKYEKQNDSKDWRGKEEKKDQKEGKEPREWPKGKEEWKGEREWKKGKDGYKESGKGKGEKRDWKERGEKKDWKKDGEWKTGHVKDHGEGEERKKEWRKEPSNEGKWKREGGREEKKEDDWRKDRRGVHKEERKHEKKEHQDHHREHLWKGPGDGEPLHTHRHSLLDQPDYWGRQREKLRHNPRDPHSCDSAEKCAQAEGLRPVTFPEFTAVLQVYLAKAEAAGVDASKRDELSKLAAEFFKDGVFTHDKMSFRGFVEEVDDILEDMVEGGESEGEEDSAIEEEMDGFEREVVEKFSVQGVGGGEEGKKDSGRGRG